MSTILVMFCVNDPDDGSPTGRIESVHVGELIQLDGPIDHSDTAEDWVGETEFVEREQAVVIGGETFPHCGYSTWVGNWCWDAAHMRPETVLALLNHLKAHDWVCCEAESSLFERWCETGPLTLDDLKAAGMEAAS